MALQYFVLLQVIVIVVLDNVITGFPHPPKVGLTGPTINYISVEFLKFACE